MIKSFLFSKNNIKENAYFWNMVGSMLNAFQSVIILMVLTRVVGLDDAGVYTIAYANANLFLNIGRYGMRYFQVSDVRKQFNFSDYLYSRIISCTFMVVISIIYTLYVSWIGAYSYKKILIIIWMCIFKVVDAVEDVFHGMYQANGRLDVAGKMLTVRMFITIIIYITILVYTKNQLFSLIITTIVTTILAYKLISISLFEFNCFITKPNIKNTTILLKICFPLFASAFLSFYIGNAPKYAIDSVLTDELQAYYGFIAMPVFVVSLLNSFIFNPMLHKLSVLWKEREINLFIKNIFIQTGIIFLITIICIIGAYLIGVPTLSWLYNTDLTPYKTELLVLLFGGGFLGLSGLLNAMITIIRYQNGMMLGYLIISFFALAYSNKVVSLYGLMGASVLYVALMAGLCCIFTLILFIGIYKGRKFLKEPK